MRYSIIIPVYNVEIYLKQCVDSILNQKYKDYEIILVDDGSTDNSGKLCDVFGRQFDSIKVVHKVNGGLSSARNVGAKMAKGDYIIFLDSDDYWVNDNCLLVINESIKRTNCDVLVWNSCKYFERLKRFEKRITQTEKVKVVNPKENILSQYEFRACAWDKAINKNIYEKEQYSFREGTLSEDVEWTFDLLKNIKHIALLDYQINVYRQRAGSITKTQREKKTVDMIAHIDILLKKANMIQEEILRRNCYSYIAEQYVNCIISGGRSKIIKKYKEFFRESLFVLEYGKTSKIYVIKNLLNILGYKLTCFLCGTAFDVRNYLIS